MPPEQTERRDLLAYQVVEQAEAIKRTETQLLKELASMKEQFLAKTKEFEEHQKKTDAAVKALEDQRNNFLVWGIIVLGSGMVSLIGFVVNLFLSGKR